MTFKKEKYKDMLGNELKVKFGVGGFSSDITYVSLHKKINVPILSNCKIRIWKNVFTLATGDSLLEVAQWTDRQYSELAHNAIRKYNDKVASSEAIASVHKKIKDLNS